MGLAEWFLIGGSQTYSKIVVKPESSVGLEGIDIQVG